MSGVNKETRSVKTARRLAEQAQREGLTPHHMQTLIASSRKADEENRSGFRDGRVLGHSRWQNRRIHALRKGLNQLPDGTKIPIRRTPDLLCATCPVREPATKEGRRWFNANRLQPGERPCDPEGEMIARGDREALLLIARHTGRTDAVRVEELRRIPLRKKRDPRPRRRRGQNRD